MVAILNPTFSKKDHYLGFQFNYYFERYNEIHPLMRYYNYVFTCSLCQSFKPRWYIMCVVLGLCVGDVSQLLPRQTLASYLENWLSRFCVLKNWLALVTFKSDWFQTHKHESWRKRQKKKEMSKKQTTLVIHQGGTPSDSTHFVKFSHVMQPWH